jgi:hypothetical protein
MWPVSSLPKAASILVENGKLRVGMGDHNQPWTVAHEPESLLPAGIAQAQMPELPIRDERSMQGRRASPSGAGGGAQDGRHLWSPVDVAGETA